MNLSMGRYVRNNRGLTLIEIMMAVAVFGIMIVFISQTAGTTERLKAGNFDQVRMMELARLETEKYKAGNYTPAYADIAYPPGTTEQKYGVKYETIYPVNAPGKLLRITVGPPGSPPDPSNPENYVLVSWLQPGQLQFDNINYTVAENGGSATITVTRTGGYYGPVSVHYSTSDGSATAGSDYTAVSGTLSFAHGETSKSFSVPILTDSLVDEGNETVNLTLSNVSGDVTLGTPSSATLTIADNAPAQLQFSSSSYSVAENVSGGTYNITVTRTGSSSGTVRVSYAVTGGTATGGGTDYTLAGGTLIFGDGETIKTITVTINDDLLYEGNETVTLALYNPTGGAVLGSPGMTTLTIVDNETGEPTSTIPGGVWGLPGDWSQPPSHWTVITGPDGTIFKSGGTGQSDYIFYKNTLTDFNYVSYLEFFGTGNHDNARAGITFGTTASSSDNEFYIYGDDLYYNGSMIHNNVVNLTAGIKYYLQAIKSGSSLTLRFGYVDANNRILPYVATWSGTISPSSGSYYLGLYDDTAGNYTVEFTFPPVVGG